MKRGEHDIADEFLDRDQVPVVIVAGAWGQILIPIAVSVSLDDPFDRPFADDPRTISSLGVGCLVQGLSFGQALDWIWIEAP